jgi:predicted membrane channel-forming protein YqfA (hemolysin III family)
MKYINIVIFTLVFIFALVWTFNHINPWLALAGVVAYIYGVIFYINSQTPKQVEK